MFYDLHLLCLINLECLFFNFWFCLAILAPLYFEFYSCFAVTCLSFFFWTHIYQGLHCMYLTCKEQECMSKTWIPRPRLSIQACNTCFCYTSKLCLGLEMYLLKYFTCQIRIPLKVLTLFQENGDFQLRLSGPGRLTVLCQLLAPGFPLQPSMSLTQSLNSLCLAQDQCPK